jgi:hypothetical protein
MVLELMFKKVLKKMELEVVLEVVAQPWPDTQWHLL